MKKKKGRFSRFLNPTLIIVDLLIIIIISVVSSAGPFLLILLSFSWIVISTFTRFYQVFRFTPEIKIFTLILIQYLFFTLSFFAIIGIFGSTELLNNKFLEVNHILSLSTIIIITVGAFKFFVYYLLLRFRVVFGGCLGGVLDEFKKVLEVKAITIKPVEIEKKKPPIRYY